MEDNSSQQELIMSDLDEETVRNGVETCVTNQLHDSSIRSSQHALRNICFIVTATLFMFGIGFLIGVIAHTKRDERNAPSYTESTSSEDMVQMETIMDWSNVTSLFKNKLTISSIDKSLNEFSSVSHQAGSPGDEELSRKIWKKFLDFGMKPWNDEHFVRIPTRPAKGTNTVVFHNTTFSETGFLAYSPTGKVQVANAAHVNASAVLIYPDPADYSIGEETNLFGHVHLGSGDPFTPGFPSSNHTQFSSVKSLGLPSIPAQTIRAATAAAIIRKLGGPDLPPEWAGGGLRDVTYKLGCGDDNISVEVENFLSAMKISNVFGVIKGFIDPDRYVVIGGQRDAWGPGFAKSTIGTSLLIELARVISSMIHEDGFEPRRSMVFASWSAGEYGAVGATEWLEGYLSSLNMKAVSYISLDKVVTGSFFKASASPLMYDLIASTLKENKQYLFFGTMLDTRKNLEAETPTEFLVLAKAAGEIAGVMALRLVHDHLLKLNVEKYKNILRIHISKINKEVMRLQKSSHLTEHVQVQWLISAMGSYSRASTRLITITENSDLDDLAQCRIINDQIIGVERNLLSPYVSPQDAPFRHILLGSGSHTLGALVTDLDSMQNGSASADAVLLNNQIAMASWIIRSCANALAGNVWDVESDLD
ncbi:Transferrin receptor protein 1 [Bagarius yarrelli]|uniref:Transferrin receptor protein 1 n=1 Tax=Bagarius yarrelli TaxID=175774 RepID=A0A556VK92_BAGYA|nr:Transferrin receptor protein 1 [Bagarius yarrelli]